MSLIGVSATILLALAGIVRSEPGPQPPERWGTVLGPVTSGVQAEIPLPTDDEIFRALRIKPRADLRVRIAKVSEYTDPPRVYPVVGPARLCHVQYDCRIEDANGTRRARVDQNHLHIVGE